MRVPIPNSRLSQTFAEHLRGATGGSRTHRLQVRAKSQPGQGRGFGPTPRDLPADLSNLLLTGVLDLAGRGHTLTKEPLTRFCNQFGDGS